MIWYKPKVQHFRDTVRYRDTVMWSGLFLIIRTLLLLFKVSHFTFLPKKNTYYCFSPAAKNKDPRHTCLRLSPLAFCSSLHQIQGLHAHVQDLVWNITP